jgi:hypothetical protein
MGLLHLMVARRRPARAGKEWRCVGQLNIFLVAKVRKGNDIPQLLDNFGKRLQR